MVALSANHLDFYLACESSDSSDDVVLRVKNTRRALKDPYPNTGTGPIA